MLPKLRWAEPCEAWIMHIIFDPQHSKSECGLNCHVAWLWKLSINAPNGVGHRPAELCFKQLKGYLWTLKTLGAGAWVDIEINGTTFLFLLDESKFLSYQWVFGVSSMSSTYHDKEVFWLLIPRHSPLCICKYGSYIVTCGFIITGELIFDGVKLVQYTILSWMR
jgi:hypothetical protein